MFLIDMLSLFEHVVVHYDGRVYTSEVLVDDEYDIDVQCIQLSVSISYCRLTVISIGTRHLMLQ